MKELIPLKKDIIFKSKISEVTAINVEHTFKIHDDVVEGDLILTGTYKMTEASLIEEEYYYKIPFSIAIGKSILKDTINIEIEDFKYNVEKDIMKIEAVLCFTCEKEEIMKEDSFDKDLLDDFFKEDEVNIENEINTNNIEEKIDIDVNNQDEDTLNMITNTITNNEVYNTYKVYLVREGDTVDTICAKYNVKYEDIKEYNDLTNINIGDKIIIPYISDAKI